MPVFEVGTYTYFGEQIGYIGGTEGEVAVFLILGDNTTPNKFLVVYDLYNVGPMVARVCDDMAHVDMLLNAMDKYLTFLNVEALQHEMEYRLAASNYFPDLWIPPTKNKQEPTIVHKVVVV